MPTTHGPRQVRGTTAAWAASSFVPFDGELVGLRRPDGLVELRMGDGVHVFSGSAQIYTGVTGGDGDGDSTVIEYDMAATMEAARAAAAGDG